MSDRDREANGGTPVSLDEILVEVGRDLADEVWRPEESTIVAYLTGTANELEICEVREAVLYSPEFRDDLVELKRTMDDLAAPGLAERFDREEVRVPPRFESVLGREDLPAAPASPRRGSWWSQIAGVRFLVRRPAYALALLLALIAFPVYRSLGPGPDRAGPALPAVSVFLREDPRGVVRGEADRPRLPQVDVEATDPLVQLTLEVPRSSAARSWHATVSDRTGEVWRSEGPRPVRTVDEDRVVLLELDPRTIDAGIVTLVLKEADAHPDARREAQSAVYRFTLVKRE